MTVVRQALVCLVFLGLVTSDAVADKRVALVIGNSDYANMTPLNNPVGDANAVGAVLERQGFDVSLHLDIDRATFLDVLEEFRFVSQGANVALLYYAGHGMEVGGRNIVGPVDIEIDCEAERPRRAVGLDQLFSAVEPAVNRVVLLDSCRNDPLPNCRSRGSGEGGFRGLERVSTAEGALLLASATLPGQLANDGPAGEHSPFAAALLQRFEREPNKLIYQNLNDVARDVREATGGAQIPEVIARGGLPEICLASAGCSSASTAAATGAEEERLRSEIEALRQQLARATPSTDDVRSDGSVSVAASPTLQSVRARGALACGVNTGLPGFSEPDAQGAWRGIDADLCRGVAAAVLGDPNAVTFVPLSARERFTALQSGKIDVLIRNTAWTSSRETDLGLRFVGTNVYDGTAFMVRRDIGVTSAVHLSGAAICLMSGTTTELDVATYFNANGMSYEVVAFDRFDEAVAAYEAGRCDVLPTDATGLYVQRLRLSHPEDHIVLPERLTQEQLGPYVRDGDDNWLNIVRHVLNVLVWAEELGITSANVDEMASSDDFRARRLFGGEIGAGLGLSRDWARAVIGAIGNYGEVFERNLGEGSPFNMERGLNELVARGGLMAAPAMR